MSNRYQQLKRARELYNQIKVGNNLKMNIERLERRQKLLKELAAKQLQLMKEPVPRFYNLKSVLMIILGASGMSLVLKYQHLFNNILPENLLVESPYIDDPDKLGIGRQSLYYYSQSMYFQALSGWTLVFLKRSRMISPLTYIMVSMGFLAATYLTDYYSHPNLKHTLWFFYNITFGAVLGSYFYQQNFLILIDALYLIGNSMTFYAAATYYNQEDNQGILLTALCCSVFGVFYGLGVLRLFRWGYKLNDWKLYAIVGSVLSLLMSWSVYRSVQVQDEYEIQDFNPINASLTYSWKQIPQVSVFVDAFHHNLYKKKVKLTRPSQSQQYQQQPNKWMQNWYQKQITDQQLWMGAASDVLRNQQLLLQIMRNQTHCDHNYQDKKQMDVDNNEDQK